MNVLKFKSISNLVRDTKSILKRFPVVIVTSYIAMIFSVYLHHSSSGDDRAVIRGIFTIILGIPLFLGLNLLLQRISITRNVTRYLLMSLGVGILLLFNYVNTETATKIYFLKYFQMSLVVHLFVSIVMFDKEDEINGFWQFNKTLFVRFVLTSVYTAFLYVGSLLVILSINYLFDDPISPKIYLDLFYFCMLVFFTTHFLGGIPKDLDCLNFSLEYPNGLKIFTQYLLIPLLSVYICVMYGYLGKIVLSWDLPKGLVSWMISIMSVLGILNLLLIYPKSGDEENRWIRTYSKYFYIVLIPLIGLLFIAVGKRISDYGVTENRYFLSAIAIWLLFISVYFTFSRKKDIRLIPKSLFILVVLTSLGPWGAYEISLRSQISQLESLLIENNILVKGIIKKDFQEVKYEDQKEISSKMSYVHSNYGNASFKWKFEDSSIKISKDMTPQVIMDKLGLTFYPHHHTRTSTLIRYSSQIYYHKPLDIHEFDYIKKFNIHTKESFEIRKSKYELSISQDQMNLNLIKNGNVLTKFNLFELYENLEKTYSEYRGGYLPEESMVLVRSTDGLKLKIILDHFMGVKREGGIRVDRVDGVILLRELNAK